MTRSGFSFSAALASAQTQDKPETAKKSSSPANSAFSFSGALSAAQADSKSKHEAKPAGFSFSAALSAVDNEAKVERVKDTQTQAELTPESTRLSNAKMLAADNWQRGEVQLKCIEKWHETHDVISFRFQGIEPVKFNFKPGQFITFKLNIDAKPVYRSYTIASSPSRPYSLMVTVKKIDAGLVSNYLAEQLNVGDEVSVTGPDGVFNLVDIQADKYLFLSAGSGITPMHSMSRWLCDTQAGSDIAFVHSARSVDDIIFADSVGSMAQRSDSFSLSYILESDAKLVSIQHANQQTQYALGRLDIEKLTQLVADYQTRTVFVCGPEPYMVAVKSMLQQAGFDMSHFYQESFGGAVKVSSSAETNDTIKNGAAQFTLKIADKAISLGEDQTLLEGIESEGLPIIAACRSGVCGACKCKVTSGSTQSSSSMTLTEQEISEGYVLACSTTIKSDVNLII